jgi:hypothetical protein
VHLHQWKTGLYLVGAAFEATGLLLLWTPDIRPDIAAVWRRACALATAMWHRAAGMLRRLAHRPRNVTRQVADAIAISDTLRAQVIRGVPDRTLGEQVQGLVEHDREGQQRLNVLEQRVDEEAVARERDLDAVRADLEQHAVRAALAAVDLGRRRRAIGTGLITVGLIVSTAGNLA